MRRADVEVPENVAEKVPEKIIPPNLRKVLRNVKMKKHRVLSINFGLGMISSKLRGKLLM